MQMLHHSSEKTTPYSHASTNSKAPDYRTLPAKTKAAVTRDVDAWRERILRLLGIRGKAAQVARHLANMQVGEWEPGKRFFYKTQRFGAHFSKSRDTETQRETGSTLLRRQFEETFPRAGRNPLVRIKAKPGSGEGHQTIDWLTIAAIDAGNNFERIGKQSKEWQDAQKLGRASRHEKTAIEEAIRDSYAQSAIDKWIPKCDAQLVDEDGELRGYVSQEMAAELCDENPGWHWTPYAWTEPEPKPESAPESDTESAPAEDTPYTYSERAALKTWLDRVNDEGLSWRTAFDDPAEYRRAICDGLRKTAQILEASMYGATARYNAPRPASLTHQDTAESSPPPPAFCNPEHEFLSSPVGDYSEGGPPLQTGGGTLASESVTDCDFSELEEREKNVEPEECLEDSGGDSHLDWALSYAARGWPVFPVCGVEAGKCGAVHKDKEKNIVKCDQPGKKPIYGWQETATTDARQIRRWWKQYPAANIGLRLDGRIVLDADAKDGGLLSLESIRDQFELPETLTADTQSGGVHAVYAIPEGFDIARLKSWVRVLPGLDLKVDNRGYILVEPSRGVNGAYQWRDFSASVEPLPVEACEYLIECEAANKARRQAEKAAKDPERAARLAAGTVARPAGTVALPDQQRYFRDMPVGERHNRVHMVGMAVRTQHAGTLDDVKAAMEYHARRFSTPLEDADYIERTARGICEEFPPSVLAA